ncbi:MAG TPA: lysylphosphatidylglycerol synthase transmembrane domain-containing protein [Candidatus Obscuribacterales bacterium]
MNENQDAKILVAAGEAEVGAGEASGNAPPEGSPLVQAQPSTSGRGLQLLKQLAAFVVAGLCIWLAFRGIDLSQVWASMQKVNLNWVLALAASTLISHWLRAIRWVIMLQPLSEKKISTWNAFCAIMFGYAVNIPIPRGGEVARVIAVSRSENIPWVGVVPTLLIDRLLDFALLVCFVGLTLAILPPDLRSNAGLLVPAGVAMCAATVIGLVLLPAGAKIIRAVLGFPLLHNRLPETLRSKLLQFADQFEQGTKFLSKPVNLPIIGLLSFAIWGFYFANFYCTLQAFDLLSKFDFARSMIVWTIASVSVIAPTPGCVGTYHIAASKALNMVAGVPPAEALAVATLIHAISFVLVPVATAALCFASQNIARRNTHAA